MAENHPAVQQKGVHPSYKSTPGQSPMGDQVRAGRINDAKILSKVTKEESEQIKPKLQGLAEGGESANIAVVE